MVLVVNAILSWFTLAVFAVMPRKLPAAANTLAYMVLAIIDINKLSILSFHYHFFVISKQVPDFLSVILHRDIIISVTLLIFMNTTLQAKRRTVLWAGAGIYTYLLLLCWIMHLFGAVEYRDWGWEINGLLILLLMGLSWVLGRGFKSLGAGGGETWRM
ncbi:hypothetical protein [Gorillibacterium sp. sgz5001074]|uniref:hypothetical protein n=1 Tax=Gorillibacterium sp. sgz5001074 TaxID=3446695 RepID=UPI003F66B5ED